MNLSPSFLTKGFFCPEEKSLLSRMCLPWPLVLLTAGSLEEEVSPGLAVDPVSLPSDPGSCSLPVPPGNQGQVQKAPPEAGPGPGCPLRLQGMERVGSASQVGAMSRHLVCALSPSPNQAELMLLCIFSPPLSKSSGRAKVFFFLSFLIKTLFFK